MAFRYPTPFREAACVRMLAGQRVEGLAAELGVSVATLHRWKAQALVDVGRKAGLKSYEPTSFPAQDDGSRTSRPSSRSSRPPVPCSTARKSSAQKARAGRPRADRLGYSGRISCRVVGMNRSTFRNHKTRHPSNRDVQRVLLGDTIKELHIASRSTYGVRRMKAALFHERGLSSVHRDRHACGEAAERASHRFVTSFSSERSVGTSPDGGDQQSGTSKSVLWVQLLVSQHPHASPFMKVFAAAQYRLFQGEE
jgi:hypothetical protein